MVFLMFPDAVWQGQLAHGLQVTDNPALVHDDERGLLDQVLDVGLVEHIKRVQYVEKFGW